MNDGNGTPASYIECFQFFLAPTNLGGTAADPDLAPDVINNSWGCPVSEGCDAASTESLRQTVAAVRAAGIVVVASAGNSGSSCSTIQDPPCEPRRELLVGSTDSADNIAGSSSRGPGTLGGRLKPDVGTLGSAFVRAPATAAMASARARAWRGRMLLDWSLC